MELAVTLTSQVGRVVFNSPVKGTVENATLALTASGDMAGTLKATVEAGALKGGSYDIGGNVGTWSATRKP